MRYGIFILLTCVVLLSGCRSSKETYSGHERTEIRTVHDTVRDSVKTSVEKIVRDSVIVRQRGDTVYVDRWHVRSNTGNSFVKTSS